MSARLDAFQTTSDAIKAYLGFSQTIERCGLERRLQELVKIRASQINRCVFCLDMHTRDALAAGEVPRRLLLLDAWRHSPDYSPRERAALAWTDSLTRLPDADPPDAEYTDLERHFSPEERVHLTLLIVTINGWNRINAAFATPPGYARA